MIATVVIFVMAQGRGSRWAVSARGDVSAPPVPYRHMLPVPPDRTLAARTVDVLLGTFPGCDLIFIGPPMFLGPYRHPRLHQVLLGATGQYHTDALVEAERIGLWPRGEELLYVLGDVLLSRRSAQRWSSAIGAEPLAPLLLCRRQPNWVTGKEASENFGLYIPCRERDRVLATATDWAARPRTRPPRPWVLPILARPELLGAVDLARGLAQWPSPLGLETDDYTDDVDSPEEHAAFWRPMLLAALEEDGVRPPSWLYVPPTRRAGVAGAEAGEPNAEGAAARPQGDESADDEEAGELPPWTPRGRAREFAASRRLRLALLAAQRDEARAWLEDDKGGD